MFRLILATNPSISKQIKRSFIADEYLAEEIHLNCSDERSLVAGSTSANKLARQVQSCTKMRALGCVILPTAHET